MEQRQTHSYYIISSFICPQPTHCSTDAIGGKQGLKVLRVSITWMFPTGPILGKAVKLAT